ncbi:hypothetical protein A3A95_01330 [Candidatus Nomurabacteria bacterium RIFCSPLOWO2_01_FULL_39_18]|uniref:Glycosyl transferase family 11 n=1 Tax=Candidatus Nomurabacteria bacterium RIFCSPHIGHO2_01_FULL_40_24b TaxID=1801739 RepID=A0A1F6V863_9BACT|nr:MAG: hypothetical protein A2647_00360 [Candidatus Nomurabacteria bacterium RIFCSPHIGHO2_01_FULL_40_24b]OGI88931.1 MAG: hypothetical protein A3A95_01330 [Candidatus Nomurabacteria bacterium RIFCSPLOWO2_01_FULL_39_18]
MIIVRLKGGIGNQMFQYALGRVLALKNNTGLELDTSFLNLNLTTVTKRNFSLDVFNIEAKIIESSYLVMLFRRIFQRKGREKTFNFDKKILSIGSDVSLDGYWHSPKYFAGFEDVIRKDFTPKNPPVQNIQNLMDEIRNQNSLCIHVRREDYVGNKYYEVINSEYYERGIEYISSKTALEKIYVFSDDIDWCRGNLSFKLPTMFVGDEYAGLKNEGHMYLMSKCRNFIIANSSFSWWGAWLSSYKDKIVVCPKQWFGDASRDTSDLIPEDWIPLEII